MSHSFNGVTVPRLDELLKLILDGNNFAEPPTVPSEPEAICPSCAGFGYADTPQNQRGPDDHRIRLRSPRTGKKVQRCAAMPLCDFCKGLGKVFPNRVCECGMPAVFESLLDKVWYCGDGSCLSSAKNRKNCESYMAAGPWPTYDCYGDC